MFILPFNKNNPVRKTPWVVLYLMFINGMILVGEYILGPPESWFATRGFVSAHPSILSAFTSMFLHAGFWHFAGNMFFLWMFGNRVEGALGRSLFFITYISSGLCGTFCYYLLDRHSTIPCVGASGAISGIVGCFCVMFPKARFDLDIYFGWFRLNSYETSAYVAALAWFGEQTILGVLSMKWGDIGGVAYWGHFGGFVSGVLFGILFRGLLGEQASEPTDIVGEEGYFEKRPSDTTELKL